MKINQVVEVKPTLTEKEFLRMVLSQLASAAEVPFDVAEKIEFGEVKHTADYALFLNYRQDLEYSAIIGQKTNGGFIQWMQKPYMGVFSSDEVSVSILERENNESDLYEWGDQISWVNGFLKNEITEETYKLSTEILDKTFEIPASESEGWVDYNRDNDDLVDDDVISSSELLREMNIIDEIPADKHKDLKYLRVKKEIIDSKVYKLHNYEVSYTYEGQTYYAKARAIKESNEVLWGSDGAYSTPKEKKSLPEIVSNKQKAPVLLANISWILTYASAALSIILSILGNSSLWYLPFIMTAASVVVTIVCNSVSKTIGNAICRRYSAKSRAKTIMPSLHRRIETLGLGELTEADTTKIMEMFESPKFPEDKKVEMGGKIAVSIFLSIGAAIMAFCFGFAANL